MKSRAAWVAVLSVLGSSCAATDAPLAPAGHTLQASDPPSEQPNEEPPLPMPEGRLVSFQTELNHVSQVRNLAGLSELHGLEVERSELIAHVERAVALEVPEKALRGTEAMLIGLGVVPPDFDYHATMLELLSNKLAGLYDPHLKTMLIREGLDPITREMTLLHELVHALQDQHFDLDEVVEWNQDDTDRSGALSALAEGDATSAMFDGMFKDGKTAMSLPPGFIQERMRADRGTPEGVPDVIARSLKASYLDGVTFVHALRRRGGWDEVDRVWKRPPTTTEQILHVEKYDANEKALEVAVPPPPHDSGWKEILHDVWGEQNLRLLFEEWMSVDAATAAATGWGGDRIVAYENEEGARFVAWHIRGDDEAAAIRFARGFVAAFEEAKMTSGDSCGKVAADRTPWGVRRAGAAVLVASSPLPAELSLASHCEAIHGYLLTHLGDPGSP